MQRIVKACLTLFMFGWIMFQTGWAATDAGPWTHVIDLRVTEEGKYHPDGPAPSLVIDPLPSPVPAEECYLSFEATASIPVNMMLYWWKNPAVDLFEKHVTLSLPPLSEPKLFAVDLNYLGNFNGADCIRINSVLTELGIKNVRFLRFDELAEEQIQQLIDFRCMTSKLHYQPGELIDFRAKLFARNYPEKRSAKIIEFSLLDGEGNLLASQTKHYGLAKIQQIKEIYGNWQLETPLAPGTYRLRAVSTDMLTGRRLESEHQFGVQGANDPYVYETPFKFIKDHSIIYGLDQRWHVFSITGDLAFGHDWAPAGHERTFEHASSADLRHWEHHPPVISIEDKPYPDGNGTYKDRNVWAPHVMRHGDTYYMFYTSINRYVSQSVSLATSKDLYHWEEYEGNPVLSPEGLEWASWGRNRWGDCRDPMVFADDDGKFYMYATAATNIPETPGAVIVAESTDLFHWENRMIALPTPGPPESPVVWKQAGKYYMTTSAQGGGTWVSDHPMTGWQRAEFPRPDIAGNEKYVPTSGSYAEEFEWLPDGRGVMSSTTFRHWGNSIYFWQVEFAPEGQPSVYTSPFPMAP